MRIHTPDEKKEEINKTARRNKEPAPKVTSVLKKNNLLEAAVTQKAYKEIPKNLKTQGLENRRQWVYAPTIYDNERIHD